MVVCTTGVCKLSKAHINFVAPYLLKKGRTLVLCATPWITDITTVQNIVIIAIVSRLQRKSSYENIQPYNIQQKA
jgi:hypothetical protein